MAVAFAEEASRIRRTGHLSDLQIGRAVGAAPSTVRDWFARRSSPTGTRAERVAELAEIVDRLTRVMEPSYIPVWLLRPIEALGNRKPLDLIALGQARRVARLISGLESPGAVQEISALAPDPRAFDPSGIWLRHVPHGADPRLRPVPASDNRWQRGSVVDALYLARDEDTLWAEWYRHLAERGLPPLHALPRDVWRFRVPPLRIADLSAADRLGEAGLEPPRPGRGTWRAYQRVGESLWRAGWQGLLAPSAARPEGLVLCLFVADPTRLPATPLRPPRTVAEPPAPPQGMRT